MSDKAPARGLRLSGTLLVAFGLLAGGLGLLAVGIAGYATWDQAAFEGSALETRGRVARFERVPTGRRSGQRFRTQTVVEFMTAAGVRHSLRSSFRGDPFRVGDEVAVLYPPARPREARLAAEWPGWGSKVRNSFALGGLFMLTLCVAMAVAGLALLRRGRG